MKDQMAGKRITDFRVTCVADHEQYYLGHSIMFTDYTHSGQGCGETLREAFEDALESLYQMGSPKEGELTAVPTDALRAVEADILAELTSQVKAPEMLDWHIVKAECPAQGKHVCTACGGNTQDLTCDHEPDCAVCAGEWYYYVNIDVKIEGNSQS